MSSDSAYTRKCKFIANKKWYPFLVQQEGRSKDITLFSSVPYNTESIYVRGTFNGYYYFTTFDNAIELKKYIEIFHPAHRCFDEIVVSNTQKPRFDVDIKDTQVSGSLDVVLQDILDYLLNAIEKMINGISLESNIRIYTSHGPSKRSLHLIIDGYFHDSHDSAKGFYQCILEYIPEVLREYIDHGIYGQNKQLRIVSCTKWNDIRPKTLQDKFRYRDRVIETKWTELDNDNIKFASSLITQIANCTILPSYAIEKKAINNAIVNDIVINAALNLASKRLGNKFTFEYNKSVGSLVLLRRISPSLCPTCNIIHEKEHPFLRISGLDVYFNCRRDSGGRSTHLGRIDEMDNIDETNTKPTEEKGEVIKLENKGTFVIRNRETSVKLENKGVFTIRSKKEDITNDSSTKMEISLPEPTKIDPPRLDISKMSTKDIMNKFSAINRCERKRKSRKAKEDTENLSSMVDITLLF